MNAGDEIRRARRRSGLTQAELADRSSTSQATISAYESGTKQPSVDTLSRLLAVTGARLAVVHDAPRVREASRAELAAAGRTLVQVLDLAGELPVRHAPDLRFPRLSAHGAAR